MRTRARRGADNTDVNGAELSPLLALPTQETPRSTRKRKQQSSVSDPTKVTDDDHGGAEPSEVEASVVTPLSRAKRSRGSKTPIASVANPSFISGNVIGSSKAAASLRKLTETSSSPGRAAGSNADNSAEAFDQHSVHETGGVGRQASANVAKGEASSSTSTESEESTVAAFAVPKNKVSSAAATVPAVVAPKGRSVSGRDWKVRKQSQRASMQVTTATETLSTTWAKKLELKAKRKAIIAMEQEMKDRKRREIEDKKQEKLEREKRRQQNEMKNTTYQTISKTHKMKTMSKKQLRQIKKRQVNSRTGEIEFVSPWGGGKKK